MLTLFLFPAFTVSGQITRNILIAICLLCSHPTMPKKLREPGILLIAWFAWAIFCSFISDNWLMSLFGYHRRFEGLNTWVLAIAFGWLFWRTSHLIRLLGTCLLIMTICLVMMIWKPDIYGQIMFGHIAIAAFVTVASAMMMSERWYAVLIPLPFIYLTQNRSIILGMLAASACYVAMNRKLIHKNQWKVMGAIAILTLFVAWPKLKHVNPSEMGHGMRSQTAVKAIEFATLKPLTGYGIDTQSTLFGSDMGEFNEIRPSDGRIVKIPFTIDRCHNFFLDILVQTGVIGLILWLFILTRIVYGAFSFPSQVNTACLYGTASAISFSLLNPMGIPSMILLCVCVMGIEKKEEVQL